MTHSAHCVLTGCDFVVVQFATDSMCVLCDWARNIDFRLALGARWWPAVAAKVKGLDSDGRREPSGARRGAKKVPGRASRAR